MCPSLDHKTHNMSLKHHNKQKGHKSRNTVQMNLERMSELWQNACKCARQIVVRKRHGTFHTKILYIIITFNTEIPSKSFIIYLHSTNVSSIQSSNLKNKYEIICSSVSMLSVKKEPSVLWFTVQTVTWTSLLKWNARNETPLGGTFVFLLVYFCYRNWMDLTWNKLWV